MTPIRPWWKDPLCLMLVLRATAGNLGFLLWECGTRDWPGAGTRVSIYLTVFFTSFTPLLVLIERLDKASEAITPEGRLASASMASADLLFSLVLGGAGAGILGLSVWTFRDSSKLSWVSDALWIPLAFHAAFAACSVGPLPAVFARIRLAETVYEAERRIRSEGTEDPPPPPA